MTTDDPSPPTFKRADSAAWLYIVEVKGASPFEGCEAAASHIYDMTMRAYELGRADGRAEFSA